MAVRGRSPGFKMPEEHRVKIQNSNILNALIEHVEGRREMSATQVTAGLGLLRKALPDLASIEHSGSVATRSANEIADDELAHIASTGSNGASSQTNGKGKPH